MGKFSQELVKLGETIAYYAPSLGDRNSITNRKVLTWATATNITAIVRTQPSSVEERSEGSRTVETLYILTTTSISKYGVVKWQSKYYDIIMVEEVFWNGSREYYKATVTERLEYLGS